MTAGIYNITIQQNVPFRKSTVFKQPNGDPVDLTGYDAKMQIRRDYSSKEVLAELTVSNGSITLGATEGTIDLYISLEDVESITADSGRYDLLLIPPSGEENAIALLKGTVTIDRGTTKL